MVKKFKSVLMRLKTIENYLNKFKDETPPLEKLESRFANLDKIYSDFVKICNELLEETNENEIDALQPQFDGVEDKLHLIRANLKILIKNYTDSNNIVDDKQSLVTKTKFSSVRLPHVNLPVFNGNPTEWLTFKDTFLSVVHNREDIDDIVKFTLLLDKLIGDARDRIGHVTLSAAGYQSAWAELVSQYDDVRVIVDVHVDALMNLPRVPKDNAVELRKLLNSCISHVSSLEACNQSIEGLGELFIINTVTKKLDSNLRKQWENQLLPNILPKWFQLKEFLMKSCRVLASVVSLNHIDLTKPLPNKQASNQSTSKNSPIPNRFKSNFTANYSYQTANHNKSGTQKPNKPCVFCNASFHPFYTCPEFIRMPVPDRYRKIVELKLCINCFGANHFNKNCHKIGCKLCSLKHNTLLHRENVSAQAKVDDASVVSKVPLPNNQLNYCTQNFSPKKQVLLSTALILIRDNNQKYHECRVLLDSASQSNFISIDFANRINLSRETINNILVSGLSETKTNVTECISTVIKSRISDFQHPLSFLIVPTISKALPQNDIDISRWALPNNVILADPCFNTSRQVDALIGAELFLKVLTNNRIQLNSNLPVFQETVFGWIFSGQYIEQNSFSLVTTDQQQREVDNLNHSIQRFWEMESMPVRKFLSKDEVFCEAHFSKTQFRDETGRYTVSIPFKSNLNEIGGSKIQALHRFNFLERKLCSNPELRKQYTNFINEYKDLGHMKLVDEMHDTNDLKLYYMPHHPIIKPSSTTTKLRVVFDASAKTSSNFSLNDLMYVGPTVQQDLFSIVLRFRKYSYVFTSDINKMYRQINIDPSQTSLQRIFWRTNSSESVRTFELTTVTYGTASAPYLATRVLNQLASDEKESFPLASAAIKNFYVDDFLGGANSIKDALELQQQLIDMLSRGGFNLHKWSSNTHKLLEPIPESRREILALDDTSCRESIKALGLLWKPNADAFVFNVSPLESYGRMTKRSVLSDIARVYDPLGLLAPVLITAKIFIQSLWKCKADWDEPIPDELYLLWHEFRTQLVIVNKISLPRCVIINKSRSIELHGFSDASEQAYGACIYVKSVDESKNTSVRLLCSKSRVAPLKTISLPRLELCAALLLSRLTTTVLESMEITFDRVILWSDSLITLQWIQISPHKLKTFIANRVNEIQELTCNFTWHHVNSENNPSDLVSRGCMPKDVKHLTIWWNGPQFLHISECDLPMDSCEPTHFDFDNQTLELKQESFNFLTVSTNIFISFINRFSSFPKLIRSMSYILRFLHNIKNKSDKKTAPLSILELENATLKLVKIVQQQEFHSEIVRISQNKDFNKQSKIRCLTPFLDENKLLRVGGRLKNSSLDYDCKHQLLLPANHQFTTILFRHEHCKNLHAGPQLLMSIVRQKYWPINAKNTAKRVVRNCIPCFKIKPIIKQQIMGDLPSQRTTCSKPFNTTGVDLCGPFQIKNKKIRNAACHKVYVASFVCFVTKAIHLEILSDLTTECFIACLKRFLYRRGKCETIWSDNATNFTGSNNELKRQRQLFQAENSSNDIIRFCCSENIKWKFIPPRSPNFGGLWESSIKSLKFHLRRVASGVILSYEELHTLIVQIEGILNSRPLTVMSSDPCDPEPLTPAHFLTGGSIVAPVEPSYLEIPPNRLSSWRRVTQMVQGFWKRFHIEYLHTLQQRYKWKEASQNLKINDVVLVSDVSLPSAQWNLGLVTNVFSGKDNQIRVVEVKTKAGIFKRSISKLAKLPVDNN